MIVVALASNPTIDVPVKSSVVACTALPSTAGLLVLNPLSLTVPRALLAPIATGMVDAFVSTKVPQPSALPSIVAPPENARVTPAGTFTLAFSPINIPPDAPWKYELSDIVAVEALEAVLLPRTLKYFTAQLFFPTEPIKFI